MENFITLEQQVVVESKMKNGYELFGTTKSLLNGMPAFVLNKGKHLVVINSLGYDEHFLGKTWKLN